MLTLDGAVCDAHYCSVVTMYWDFWLWMAHFSQGESKDDACLTIVVEGAKLRFGCGCDDEP
jgi:hypothetical protein